jgi:hypothetical protein
VAKSLQESLELARRYRESRNPDKILAELARTFITRTEFQTLTGRLDGLQTIQEQAQAFRKHKEKEEDKDKKEEKLPDSTPPG